jgi:acyl-CoA synthetase (AMP-forming)/AMP-acid ligase II
MGNLELDPGLEFIRHVRLTRITCAPVHLHALCALGERRKEVLLPELRALYVSTAMVPDDLRRRTMRTVSRNLYVAYGTMEAPALTVATPEVEVADTIGSVLPRVELEVVDAADKLLPFGEIGMIRVRAAGNAGSYHDDAEASAKSFRDGWFYPGDLGLLTDDGQVIYKGRADDMMVFDGINIYPAEIEAALTMHEAVAEAAAFALKSEEHQDLPAAAVTLRAPATEAELVAHCRARLGKRAPHKVVVVEALPRSAAGKILRRALPALLQSEPGQVPVTG